MKRTAEEALMKKTERLKMDLQSWLLGNNILEPGEIVVIDIRLEQSEIVRVEMPKRGGHSLKFSSRELVEKDWEIIMKTPFTSTQRAVLNFIRKNNNAPTNVADIEIMLKEKFGKSTSCFAEAINSWLSCTRKPYRLRHPDGTQRNKFKVFIVENP